MPIQPEFLLIIFAIFVVAVLYSSVGHGGASGYLAVLSFFAFSTSTLSSTALILNILVSGIGTISFAKAGHFSRRLTIPFIVTSIPASFLGGSIKIPDRLYFLLLAVALIIAAFRLAFVSGEKGENEIPKDASITIKLLIGLVIGLLSGILGIGGGIFLSPLVIFLGWANPKVTAATSAFFILVNSLAGIGGRVLTGKFDMTLAMPLVAAAFIGGIVGSYAGAQKFSHKALKRLLAVVLLVAAVKLLIANIHS